LGHDVHTVIGQGLTGRTNREIWTRCQLEDRLLLTQDLDFSDSRRFQPGSHAGIVLVRFQNPGRVALINLLSSIFQNQDIEA
jgi:predicted nuclease of predicted toxin-antitoxin system